MLRICRLDVRRCEPESGLKAGGAEHILQQHLEEEYRGNAAEQQTDEVRIAVLVAETDGVPGDSAGGSQEHPVHQWFQTALSAPRVGVAAARRWIAAAAAAIVPHVAGRKGG